MDTSNTRNRPKILFYITPNGEVKLEVVSILEITGSKLFPFWKQLAKKMH